MDNIIYKPATKNDEPLIKSLLAKNNLPYGDIKAENIIDFIIAKYEDKIIGVIGLEIFDHVALLRSLCVEEEYRKEKIGISLYKKITAYAHAKRIIELYLLTTTADKYFNRLGFEIVNRLTAPDLIKMSLEFKDYCPSSAVFMKLSLDCAI
ncbi:arsenic resistance N-acetyltransferase ArsN2 [Leptospira noguchii]|uniref:arsenic resistance N-acetyltransferase ArsN2 n=1 Tax=Leptospira noguchii TaxID=28182 RepID=UPI001FB6280B|nr:arsenic resistance N-acetyltransferase ArsN2 [Leptospira noguchii]UOG32515.1 arsenic resistance N-acetyltransferase ArsN2 [Leptospira noguchii]UOG36081.1 arsenic resistance N-acetyltransferase ArsN2 [Leptospira noguchii]UOG47037.1 arsenic resistance N-acetyltransferase ArsN2 [Leptospira noguchii]